MPQSPLRTAKSSMKSSSNLTKLQSGLEDKPDLGLVALEPRVLLDGAGMLTLADGGQDIAAQAQAEIAAAALFQTTEPGMSDAPAQGLTIAAAPWQSQSDRLQQDGREIFFGLSAAGEGELSLDAYEGGWGEQAVSASEIVFVDTSIADYEGLLASISSDAEIVLIDSSTDGIAQIAAHLDGRSNISAIHIISHGAAGEIDLGTATLDAVSMQQTYAAQLAQIGASLAEGADILVYGCNFADGEEGMRAAQSLALLTGADVAGSTDNTGTVALEGDWDLEFATGEINQSLVLDLAQWDGVLAPLTISIDLFTTITTLTNLLGEVTGAVYENAGTIGSVSIDVVATVENDSLAGIGGSVALFSSLGDDITFQTNLLAGGSFDIVYSFFQSGTNQTVLAVGDSEFTISDIDGNGPGNPIETVAASQTGLVSFTVDEATTLETSTQGGFAIASGTANRNGQPDSAIRFEFSATNAVRLSYETFSGGRIYQHDADGDFTFVTPITTLVPVVDIGGGLGDFTTTFTENSDGILVVDAGLSITNTATLSGATVTLTNPMADDQLLINGSAAASGNIGSLAYTIGNVGGEIVIMFSGAATAAEYEAALLAVTFANGSETPDQTDRVIEITVEENGITSNINTSIIAVIGVNDLPIADNDKVFLEEDTTLTVDIASGLLDGDSDADGDPLLLTQFSIDGDLTVYLPGDSVALEEGLLTIEADGSYTFVPTPNFSGDVPIINYVVSDGVGGTATASLTICITAVNDAPIADDEKIIIDEDVSLDVGVSLGLLQGDTDADNDALLISEFTIAGDASVYLAGETVTLFEGELTINADGSYTFLPALDYVGPVPVATYVVIDGNGGVDTGTLTICLNPLNDAPVADDDTATTDEDTTLAVEASIGLLQGDTDPDDDPLQVTEFSIAGVSGSFAANATATIPDIGALTINADGSYIFVPVADYSGPVPAISYTVSDGSLTDTATLTIAISPINDAPVVEGALAPQSANEGALITPLDASVIFSDADADVLSFSATGLPGGLSIDAATGIISGTANAGTANGGPAGNGNYLVTITAADASGETVSASVSITIINDMPVAQDDGFTTSDNQPVSGNLLADNGQGEDIDPDGGAVVVTRIAAGSDEAALANLSDGDGIGIAIAGDAGGLFIVNSDGTFSFDPAGDFTSLAVGETVTTSITYQIEDDEGSVDTATVTIQIIGGNDGPQLVDPANPDNPAPDGASLIAGQSGDDGTAIEPLATADFFSDPDGDTLTFSASNLPEGLSIDPLTGEISGTISASASQFGDDPVGAPGIYAITVTAMDDSGASAELSFFYTVTNVMADMLNIGLSVSEDAALNAFSVLGDFGNGIGIDLDGDILSVTQVNGNLENLGAAVTGTMGGQFIINSDGSASFDPNGDFDDLSVGETRDTIISYTISDGQGGVDIAFTTITVIGVNDSPIAIDPSNPDGPIDLANYIPTQNVNDGAAATAFDLTPFFGDPDGNDALLISVDPATLPPGLVFDTATGVISGTVSGEASIGGTDPVNQPGVYIVPVSVMDPSGAEFITNLTYVVANPAPVAGDVSITSDEDTPITLTPEAGILGEGAIDPDGDVITLLSVAGEVSNIGVPVSGNNGGVFIVNADGSITFNPNGDFNNLGAGEQAITSLTYAISDGQGGVDNATISVTINGLNDIVVPVIDGTPVDPNTLPDLLNFIPIQTGADGALASEITLADFFADPDVGDVLTYSVNLADLPSGLVFDPISNVISGRFAADASQGGLATSPGVYIVPITVSDSFGGIFTTNITFMLTNPAPTAGADGPIPVIEDTPTFINILQNDIDLDGDIISLTQVNGVDVSPGDAVILPSGGVVRVAAIGTLTYFPAVNATGADSFTYTISDGQGGSDITTVALNIIAENDAPIATGVLPDQASTDGQTIQPVDISGSFTDLDQEPLTFTATGLPPGLILDAATGIISGALPANASVDGPYTVLITATDPVGANISAPFLWVVDNLDPIVLNPSENLHHNDGDIISPLDVVSAFAEPGPDSDLLSISVEGLPPGLSFNPETGFITGMIASDASANEPYVVTIRVDDGQGGLVADSFVWLIDNLNPGLVSEILNQAHHDGDIITSFDISSSFNDPDGDPLSFAAEGLPPGLVIDPQTGIISGILPADASADGPYTVLIMAMDPQGGMSVDSFVWDVGNVAPDLVNGEADMIATDTDQIAISTADNFVDLDGDEMVFSARGLPTGLTIDPISGMITGALSNTDSLNGPFIVEVTVTDAQGAATSDVFSLMVLNPPPIAADMPDVNVIDGQPIMISVAFTDPDSDTLTYSASGLPLGLTINPFTGLISGVPIPGEALFTDYAVVITADDGQGGISQSSFTLALNGDLTNRALQTGGSAAAGEAVFAALSAERGLGSALDFNAFERERTEITGDIASSDLVADFADNEFRGHALRLGVPGYQGDLVIEGVAGESVIYLQLSETLSEIDNVKVVQWQVSDGQANTPAMPDWLSFDKANNLVVLDRSVDDEIVILQINALLDDGRVLAGNYQVNLRTGEAQVVGEIINRAMLFQEQLEIADQREAGLDPALIEALTG